MATSPGRIVAIVVVLLAALAALAQVVPYGKDRANPPVVREPPWADGRTSEIARRACFDCHSHETAWPWYSKVPPLSWLVAHDVAEGRSSLNFSDWSGGRREGERADKIAGEIREGEMPPFLYRVAHPRARLTEAEKRDLVSGLLRTAGGGAAR